MMPAKISNCPHILTIGAVTWEELHQKQESQQCHSCAVKSPNLWLCLIGECQYVGCGESVKDHSSSHAEEKKHCLTINLTTLRIWCYVCECEVYPDRNNPPFMIAEKACSKPPTNMASNRTDVSSDSSPQRSISGADDSESDFEDENLKPKGLTGLQNLGNTCYLNAALQALSNCPPLTRFFLDCSGFVRPEKSPMLSRSYLKLITEMWHKKRPSYVIPSSVVNGIKVVHPMFRGYSQQDAQEFLRCFMDQIHEELKQSVVCCKEDCEDLEDMEDMTSSENVTSTYLSNSHDRQPSVDSSSSQSEYDTCDSGLSSDKGSAEHNMSSDDGSDVTEFTKLNSPEKVRRSPRLKAKHNSELSENCPDVVVVTKESKESANFLSKNSMETAAASSGQDTHKSESAEFVDAVSDVDNLGWTKLSVATTAKSKKSSESEQGHLQKTVKYPSKASIGVKGQGKDVQFQSVISDIFDGKVLSSVQCLTCERVSMTKETFQDLSLPIPTKDHLHMLHSSHNTTMPKGGTCGEVNQGWISLMFSWMKSWFVGPTITLQDCLAAFFSADELKGDNMYSCDKCKKLRNGVKYSKVLELPEILCVHLKRFRHEFYSSKISTYVAFPLEGLDMKAYLHKDCKSDVTAYDLIAVICHHGTAGGGHYTAYCLNYITEQWFEYDDQYVTEVDINQVINCEAYVLFYRKKNEDMLALRQEAMALMEAREPSLMLFFVSKQWINRFNTFSNPGPIVNSDFLCSHGGVPPHKVNHVEELVVPLSQSMWELLHEKFGGGPACTHLYPCNTCQLELEKLKHRQKSEMESFILLNDKFREEDNPDVIFAISMSWFKEWENFVRGKTDDPPGPVDNSRIATMKNGQPTVKSNSDHGQLSREMWQFLLGIYGGGPELVIKQNPVTTVQVSTSPNTKATSTGPSPVASGSPRGTTGSSPVTTVTSAGSTPSVSSTIQPEEITTVEKEDSVENTKL